MTLTYVSADGERFEYQSLDHDESTYMRAPDVVVRMLLKAIEVSFRKGHFGHGIFLALHPLLKYNSGPDKDDAYYVLTLALEAGVPENHARELLRLFGERLAPLWRNRASDHRQLALAYERCPREVAELLFEHLVEAGAQEAEFGNALEKCLELGLGDAALRLMDHVGVISPQAAERSLELGLEGIFERFYTQRIFRDADSLLSTAGSYPRLATKALELGASPTVRAMGTDSLLLHCATSDQVGVALLRRVERPQDFDLDHLATEAVRGGGRIGVINELARRDLLGPLFGDPLSGPALIRLALRIDEAIDPGEEVPLFLIDQGALENSSRIDRSITFAEAFKRAKERTFMRLSDEFADIIGEVKLGPDSMATIAFSCIFMGSEQPERAAEVRARVCRMLQYMWDHDLYEVAEYSADAEEFNRAYLNMIHGHLTPFLLHAFPEECVEFHVPNDEWENVGLWDQVPDCLNECFVDFWTEGLARSLGPNDELASTFIRGCEDRDTLDGETKLVVDDRLLARAIGMGMTRTADALLEKGLEIPLRVPIKSSEDDLVPIGAIFLTEGSSVEYDANEEEEPIEYELVGYPSGLTYLLDRGLSLEDIFGIPPSPKLWRQIVDSGKPEVLRVILEHEHGVRPDEMRFPFRPTRTIRNCTSTSFLSILMCNPLKSGSPRAQMAVELLNHGADPYERIGAHNAFTLSLAKDVDAMEVFEAFFENGLRLEDPRNFRVYSEAEAAADFPERDHEYLQAGVGPVELFCWNLRR